MLSDIEKNLTIASMELCLQDCHTLAGVTTLETIERFVRQLRVMFNADPESVRDDQVRLAWDMINALNPLPSRKNIIRIYRRLSPLLETMLTGQRYDATALYNGTITHNGEVS